MVGCFCTVLWPPCWMSNNTDTTSCLSVDQHAVPSTIEFVFITLVLICNKNSECVCFPSHLVARLLGSVKVV